MQSVQVPFECCRCGKVDSAPFLSGVPDRLGISNANYDYRRCKSCGLIAQFPRPSFEQTKSFYPHSFWRTDDEDARALGASKKIEAWVRNRLVMADFGLVADFFAWGVRHLDVGCATGDFIMLCKERGARSTGIELGESAVQYCREKRGLDVIRGDITAHDFGEERFDVITYNGVLEHVPDPYAHVVRCRGLLEPGGKLLVLGVPNIESAGFRLAKERWIGLDTPRHIHQFSEDSLVGLLEACGFRVTRVERRSPRFNPPSLIASVIPALHRHAFDAYEARTGRNPVLRKALLAGLLQMARPVDSLLCRLGFSEHLTVAAEPR